MESRIANGERRRVGDNEVKSDKVPAIVSESLWLRVNKKHRDQKEASKIIKPTQAGVLSGVLYCGHCRYALAKASRTERNGKRYVYYSCQSGARYPGKCDCAQWRVREDKILGPVVAKIFDGVEGHLVEMAESEEPTAEIEQANRLRNRIEEIDASVARANRRFLSDPNLSSRMEADHRSLVQEYEAEKKELEDRLRIIDLSIESRAKLVENFRGLRSVVAVRYLDGHPLTEAIKATKTMQEQRAKYGNMQVETTFILPVSVPDELRGLLKESNARVYLFWKKNGSRYWSLDHGNIEVEFDLQILEQDHNTHSHARNRDTH